MQTIQEKSKQQTIDIAFAVNENYAQYLGATLSSILTSNSDTKIITHVLYQELTPTIIEQLNILEEHQPNLSIHWIQVEAERFIQIPIQTEQFPFESFFRFLLPDLLPNCHRVLYLDVDILVKGNLSSLWTIDFEGKEIAAVRESDIYAYRPVYLNSLGFSMDSHYFSSGVLLMNLDLMRKNHSSRDLVKMAIEKGLEYKFPDQDILNLYYQEQYVFLSPAYNYTDRRKKDKDLPSEEVIIEHFNGTIKAWHPLSKIPDYLKISAATYQNYQRRYHALFDPSPKLSIIIPTQEYAHYLEACVESLLDQSYKNIEIIILNDSVDILGQYTFDYFKSFDCIKVITDRQTNLLAALKSASQHASSDFYLIVKSIDWLAEKALEEEMLPLIESQADLLIPNYFSFNEHDGYFYFPNKNYHITTVSTENLLSKNCSISLNDWQENEIYGTILTAKAFESLLSYNGEESKMMHHLFQTQQTVTNVNGHFYIKRIRKTETISILVPINNDVPHLAECLGGIRKQTYSNFEVLMMDNGAPPDSLAICQQFVEKDKRFKLVQYAQKNTKEQLQQMLQENDNELITIIQPDDCIEKYYLASLYFNLNWFQADVAIANYYEYKEEVKQFVYYVLASEFSIKTFEPSTILAKEQFSDYFNKMVATPWGKLYKKQLFEVALTSGFSIFDPNMENYRLILASTKIVVVNENAYLHRQKQTILDKEPLSLSAFEKQLQDKYQQVLDFTFAGLSIQSLINDLHDLETEAKANFTLDELEISQQYKKLQYHLKLLSKSKK
ncbi:glycosyltransferase [Streptococcus cameli]